MTNAGLGTDPRSRRTVEKLEQALREMLATEPLSEITVSGLCRRAGVHRTTFYKHFSVVRELAARVVHDVLRLDALGPAWGERHHRSWLTALLVLARSERPTLLGLIGPDGDAALARTVTNQIVARTERDLVEASAHGARMPVDPPAAAHVLGQAYFGAVMAVLTTDTSEEDLRERADSLLDLVEDAFLTT